KTFLYIWVKLLLISKNNQFKEDIFKIPDESWDYCCCFIFGATALERDRCISCFPQQSAEITPADRYGSFLGLSGQALGAAWNSRYNSLLS
ncbi:hypothetical protein, partial [Klebsiella quasipneumoniae]|uniref:hypothetical protein n=1 Tax=Klebsiella quasipneumoniae TaxID=1463165 RepID=UPI001C52D58F